MEGGDGTQKTTLKDKRLRAGLEENLREINAPLPCNLKIHLGHSMVYSRTRRNLIAIGLLLLTSCAEQAPETTMDGIYTAAQAERGKGLFTSLCERCHSVQEFSGRSFDAIWAGSPAATLYVRIATSMPLDQPGSLAISQVTALMAHIFNENKMPTGDTPLEGDLDWLAAISLARPTD